MVFPQLFVLFFSSFKIVLFFFPALQVINRFPAFQPASRTPIVQIPSIPNLLFILPALQISTCTRKEAVYFSTFVEI